MKKFDIVINQVQFFENIEIDEKDLPLTEETFFEKYYDLNNCDLNTTIESIQESE